MPRPDDHFPARVDPRDRGFRDRTSVADVLAIIEARVTAIGAEEVALADAAWRVLASEIVAIDPIPRFDRAAMDGYALRGEETFGADAYTPAPFRCIGRSRPGRACELEVGPGQVVAIATGAPLPQGADAVAKVETTQRDGDDVIVFEPVPPGRHVSRRGEDIKPGTVVLPAGRTLRPQDLAVLSALGRGRIDVIRRPRVVVLITGDEILAAGTAPFGSSIADANSPMLSALIARDGGIAEVVGPLADDRDGLRLTIDRAARSADVVLISGGSSTGPEDHAPGLVAELGELVVHGVALRPASPAGLGFISGVPVALLPGNPVSCLCAYDFFAGPIVRKLGARSARWPYRSVVRPLSRKLASPIGRVDYARVRLIADQVEPMSIGGASMLSSVTRADGFVIVPADLEGYPAGAEVVVWLYD
jgi:molybdopterin molybdotransferase